MRRLRLACLAFIVLVEGVACGGDSQGPAGPPASTPPASSVASVSVSPGSGTVEEGLSILFVAVARDASGRIVTGVTFQWEISDTAVAEINASGASGRVTGKTAGQIQVRAIADGRVGSAQLVVISSTVASLEIVAPPASLLVNEAVLLTVTARNADGITVRTPSMLQWTSSDEAIAGLGSGARSGVVTALRRGTVTITARAGSVEASVSLRVTARVSIGPGPALHCEFQVICAAIGDTLQLTAFLVDVNGAPIAEIPQVTWASGDQGVLTVSSTGLVIGLRTGRTAITASSSDDVGTQNVFVTDVVAGLPATVRFAHAAYDAGPLTFIHNRGAPVTLAFGESAERPVVSGTWSVQIDGLPPGGISEMSFLIRGGEHLTLYKTRFEFASAWIKEERVPADSGLVRFVQGSNGGWAGLVFLVAGGETRLANCYFDPGDLTEYFRVPAGEFEVITWGKFGSAENARVRATATSGRAVTYVLTGDSPQTARLLAFPDF